MYSVVRRPAFDNTVQERPRPEAKGQGGSCIFRTQCGVRQRYA